ncbi:Transcription termination factor, mitochondrial/chloroplastic [Dillenia turbinata]|uniref:Transcription termination factor, mitochondrial/chloroplastic n=1 Tax=Dillenia turbinata TaxID=194707 RepID=A0AAN8UY59_9MAGN
MKLFQSFGFSEGECFKMFRRAPVLFRVSEGKLRLGIEFFMNRMKFGKAVLVSYPTCLMNSLDDRVIPRYRVVQLLQSKKLVKNTPNFMNILSLTEKEFLEKYIAAFRDDAEEILMAYKACKIRDNKEIDEHAASHLFEREAQVAAYIEMPNTYASARRKALSIPLNSASMSGKRNQSSPVGSPLSGNLSDSSSKEQDRFLPIANVSRIMKKSLPATAKISKEAKETVQECVSEFISFITGEASDKCQREKRKTINGDDLLWAMTTLGFESYVGPLKVYLNKYRETEGEKNSLARQEDQSHNTDAANTIAVNSVVTKTDHFQSPFNGGYYPITAQVTSKGFGDGGRIIGYGENFAVEGFNMSKIGEHDGNGKRAMAAHLHHGVEW